MRSLGMSNPQSEMLEALMGDPELQSAIRNPQSAMAAVAPPGHASCPHVPVHAGLVAWRALPLHAHLLMVRP